MTSNVFEPDALVYAHLDCAVISIRVNLYSLMMGTFSLTLGVMSDTMRRTTE